MLIRLVDTWGGYAMHGLRHSRTGLMLIRLVDTWGGYAMHGLEALLDRLDAHQVGGHLGGVRHAWT